MHSLQTLQLLGLEPSSPAARRTVELVAANGRWEHAGQAYFDGEVEPCINGRTVAAGAYFGVDNDPDRRTAHRRAARRRRVELRGRARIRALLVPLDDRRARRTPSSSSGRTAGTPATREARRGGEEYLLARRLFRRLSTGAVVDQAFLEFAFPYYWRYDVLRGLDYFRKSGVWPDPRMAEAVDIVRSKRQPDGRWLLDRIHPGRVSTSISSPRSARRVGGTRCGPCGCSRGGTDGPEPAHHRQHQDEAGPPHDARLLDGGTEAPPEIVMFFLGPDGEFLDEDPHAAPRRTIADVRRAWHTASKPRRRTIRSRGIASARDRSRAPDVRPSPATSTRSSSPRCSSPERAVSVAILPALFSPPVSRLDVDESSITSRRYELDWDARIALWPWQQRRVRLRLYASPSLNVTVLALSPTKARPAAPSPDSSVSATE